MRVPGHHRITTRALLSGGVVAASVCSASAVPLYHAANLLSTPQAAFDAEQSRPHVRIRQSTTGALNNAGQLTGTGDTGSAELTADARPFLYDSAGHATANLGDVSGDFGDPAVVPRNDTSSGLGLNDAGHVVGVSSTTTSPGIADDRPFVWIDADANLAHTLGEMHELALNPGATFGRALRINNADQVLINGDTGLFRADLTVSGAPTEAGPRIAIAASADAADMNDAGDTAFIAGSSGHVWRDLNTDGLPDAPEFTRIPDMGAASVGTTAFAINNAGQVVGTMRNEHSQEVAFIWTDLDQDNAFDWADTNGNGYFESTETSSEVLRFRGDGSVLDADSGLTFLFDINDLGVAVGTYINGTTRKAFVLDPAEGVRFLDDLIDPTFPLDLRRADAINNAGQISALGKDGITGVNALALLTPRIEGDLDGDGFVGITDLNLVLGNWNQFAPPGDPSADPTGDGFVGIEDLNTVLGNWNAGAPPGAANIPEPASLLGFVVGLAAVNRRRGH